MRKVARRSRSPGAQGRGIGRHSSAPYTRIYACRRLAENLRALVEKREVGCAPTAATIRGGESADDPRAVVLHAATAAINTAPRMGRENCSTLAAQ